MQNFCCSCVQMRVSCLCLSILLLSVNSQRVRPRNEPEQPHDVNNGVTEPGWKCVIRLEATGRTRSFQWSKFAHTTVSQFQCTWLITGPPGSKIALDLQKVKFEESNQNVQCSRDFLQIIENGQDRGRYCKNSQLTDYISVAHKLRVDVQGEYQIPHLLRAQIAPFELTYHAVKSLAPSGFTKNAKAVSRPWHMKPADVPILRTIAPKTEKTDNSEMWNIGKFIIIIFFALIFLILILFFVRRNYCLGTKKEDKDQEENFVEFHLKEKPLPMAAKTRELPVGSLHIQDETARGTTEESRKHKKMVSAAEASSSSREFPVAATVPVVTKSERKQKKKESSSTKKKRRKKLSPEEEEQRKKDKMRMRRRKQRKKEKQERRQSERSDVDRLPSRGVKSKTKIAPMKEEKEKPKTERKRRKSTKEDASLKRRHRSSDNKRKSSTSDRKSGDHRKSSSSTKRKSSSSKKSKSSALAAKVASLDKKPKKKRSKRAEVFP